MKMDNHIQLKQVGRVNSSLTPVFILILIPGGCTVHTGRTLHYTKGNSTNRPRRAYIINCRPAAMVKMEREKGYTHGKEGIHDVLGKYGGDEQHEEDDWH